MAEAEQGEEEAGWGEPAEQGEEEAVQEEPGAEAAGQEEPAAEHGQEQPRKLSPYPLLARNRRLHAESEAGQGARERPKATQGATLWTFGPHILVGSQNKVQSLSERLVMSSSQTTGKDKSKARKMTIKVESPVGQPSWTTES